MTSDSHIHKIEQQFFNRDVLEVAPELLGKILVRRFNDGRLERFVITEVEAYRGEEDLACHASKGRTPRTEVMYLEGGHIYVYLIYGMYYMLNFVTDKKNNPQAVLIRGIDQIFGPGKVTRRLEIDKTFNRQSLIENNFIWLEDQQTIPSFTTHPRVGIDYAGDYWKNLPWRYRMV